MRIVLDIECYQNYFLANFIFENGQGSFKFERFNNEDNMPVMDVFRRIEGHTLITFNGKRYDLPMLSLAIAMGDNDTLKAASDSIIVDGLMWWVLERQYKFNLLTNDHIDIINLLPLYESLKLYGARNNTKRLQDLPYAPDCVVDYEMANNLRNYCDNDCKLTWELFCGLWDGVWLRMELGKKYNQDLRSRSDAQIAEAVMGSEYLRITGTKLIKPIDTGQLPTHLKYNAPDWVAFEHAELDDLLDDLEESVFEVNQGNGKPDTPDWMKKKTVTIGDRKYAVGLGGLHAQNKKESYFATENALITDIDVTSYYPSLILNCGYAPPHMGDTFTQIYKELVDQRLDAKRSGEKIAADALKITINGTFGKLGSKYSAIYAPELLLAVTLTGQLALLMLLEMMAQRGIQAVSANTDGVTVIHHDMREVRACVEQWEKRTGLNMEYTDYDAIHYRDVNNYFAVTTDYDIKTKGIFRPPGLNKNPVASIIYRAVIDYTVYGIPIMRTIKSCDDIREFLTVRTVRGGALKDGEYLGKAIRWYYSTNTDTAIYYKTTGNKVAKSDGGVPMMTLPKKLSDFPDDLDYNWYLNEAYSTLDDIGYYSWL